MIVLLADVLLAGSYLFFTLKRIEPNNDQAGHADKPLVGEFHGAERTPVFSSGLYFWIYKDSKLGYCDKTGRIIMPCIIDELHSQEEGLLYFKAGDKMGVISKEMRDDHSQLFDEVLFPDFPADGWYHEGFVRCRLDGKLGYITRSGDFSEYGDYGSCVTTSKGSRF